MRPRCKVEQWELKYNEEVNSLINAVKIDWNNEFVFKNSFLVFKKSFT